MYQSCLLMKLMLKYQLLEWKEKGKLQYKRKPSKIAALA